MIYFTADTHFNHANIIEFCGRPFGDALEMNEALIENWNSVVKPSDTIYHLGDFGFGELRHIVERLNGKKIIVLGSHDKSIINCIDLFENTDRIIELDEDEHHIVLCHYAMRVWPRSHYNSWHLYGHSHGRLQPAGKSYDVGVDNNAFKPLSFTEISEIMKKQPDNFNFIFDKHSFKGK